MDMDSDMGYRMTERWGPWGCWIYYCEKTDTYISPRTLSAAQILKHPVLQTLSSNNVELLETPQIPSLAKTA